MKRIVIDASVALKWFLFDEEHTQAALDLLERFTFHGMQIVAPFLLEYEVLNGLLIAGKKGRIEQDKMMMAVEGFLGLEIEKKDISSTYQGVLHFSDIYDLTAYDSSYLSLAAEEGIELITADERMYKKVKKDLKWVRRLGDLK